MSDEVKENSNADVPLLEFLTEVLGNFGMHPQFRIQAAAVLLAYHKRFGSGTFREVNEIKDKLRRIAIPDGTTKWGEPDDAWMQARLDACLLVLR